MNHAGVETIAVAPMGNEDLAFTYVLPEGWQPAEVSAEAPDFDNPKYFLPAAVAIAASGDAAFTVGVRPAYEDGTLRQWLEWLCGEDNIEIHEMSEFAAGQIRGYLFDATQSADGGTMRMCNLYVEDGGRLYAISTMAAPENYGPIQFSMASIAASFRLAAVHGPTVSLAPEQAASGE